jgi:hypothetical protein
MHVARADRPNKLLPSTLPKGESHKKSPAFRDSSDGNEPAFIVRMRQIGCNPGSTRKELFNFLNRYAVFLALAQIAVVPIEARDIHQ